MRLCRLLFHALALASCLCFGSVCIAQTPCRDSSCVQQLPGFSCPTAKLFDYDATTKQVLCVDCRGTQPPGETRAQPCESNKIGSIEEGRDFFCAANAWRAGPWQQLSNTCRCPEGWIWNGTICVDPGPQKDACADIPGPQIRPPPGHYSLPPDCPPILFAIRSTGLRWRNGAQPYWNTLMNQLNSRVPDWPLMPAPNDYIRQAVDYLANRWELGPCLGTPVWFGPVEVRCEKSYEDIVSTPSQTGPFHLITLSISRR